MSAIKRMSTASGLFLVGAALLAFGLMVSPAGRQAVSGAAVVRAQDEGALTETPLVPEPFVTLERGRRRTLRSMQAAEASRGLSSSPMAPSRDNAVRFLPTMDEAEYQALKQGAPALGGSALGPVAPSFRGFGRSLAAPLAPAPGDPAAPGPLAPPADFQSCEGVNNSEAGPFIPPDPHIAVGLDHVMEITNTHLDVYLKSTCVRVLSISLAAFFGYDNEAIFDPRVLYDLQFNRWLVYAEAFPENDDLQVIFLSVSTSGNPLGGYFGYRFDANILGDDFWDYGSIGMDHDAVLFTANIFRLVSADPLDVDGFKYSRFWAWPKLELYNGQGFGFCFFNGLVGTTQPTIVLDRNPITYMAGARPVDNLIFKYNLRDSARLCPSLTVTPIPVPAYTFPFNASQPGTLAQLDTLDSRFVNVGTQVFDRLVQVHTIDVGGLPTPKWYDIDVDNNFVVQQGIFFASLTSHDWNASIAQNFNLDRFVTWSSTDGFSRAGGVPTNAQVRVSGRNVGDPAGSMNLPGLVAFQSGGPYNRFRWGDYSAVVLDPRNLRHAWAVNQKNNSPVIWGTRFARFGY